MNWNEIGKTLAGLGLPLLGGAIAGPAGAAVGKLVAVQLGLKDAEPDTVAAAVADPTVFLKLRQLELDNQAQLFKITADADVAVITAVNTTMQAESRSEHWAQWTWRPYIGFCFGSAWIGNYFVLPLAHVPSPVIPTEGWLAIGAVLGVASWFRGKQKVEAA